MGIYCVQLQEPGFVTKPKVSLHRASFWGLDLEQKGLGTPRINAGHHLRGVPVSLKDPFLLPTR